MACSLECSLSDNSILSPTEAGIRVGEQLMGVECPVWPFLVKLAWLEKTESLADSRPLMFVSRILIAPCSHAMKPLPEALCLRFFEHKVGRVFRSLAFGYGKPQRMKV